MVLRYYMSVYSCILSISIHKKVDKNILTQVKKAFSLHVKCNIRIIFLLKGIWATTLANEKKLNRAFKVRLCGEFCSWIRCIIVKVSNTFTKRGVCWSLNKREVNQNPTQLCWQIRPEIAINH